MFLESLEKKKKKKKTFYMRYKVLTSVHIFILSIEPFTSVILFIHLHCFGVSFRVLEVFAVKKSAFFLV